MDDFIDAFIAWLEKETDFTEWDPAVKEHVRRHLRELAEAHFPSRAMAE